MAGLQENPSSRSESAIPEAVPASALPQVTDGIVYLPSGRSVAPESPEFEVLLRKNLPPEILPDVLTNWRGVSVRTSRLRLLAAVLFLVASAAFLYYFFPPAVHPELAPHGGLEIKFTGSSLPFSSPFRSLNREAAAAYDRGDYNAVCAMLKPDVEKIIRTGDRSSYILAFRYFQAVRQLHGKNGDRDAMKPLGDLMKKDPDTPAWLQFHFELSPRIRSVLDYEQVAHSLQQDSEYRFQIRLHRQSADNGLKELDNLRTITNRGKFSKDELKKYREDYDLYRVKLLLSKWLLKGFPAGLPDNEHDPGVSEREDALQIAREHENSACEDFWRARLFIAETLISKDSFWNHIYWNHRYHKTKDVLNSEIEKCKERLKAR